jgi:apolipoprotein N-acyltransferase
LTVANNYFATLFVFCQDPFWDGSLSSVLIWLFLFGMLTWWIMIDEGVSNTTFLGYLAIAFVSGALAALLALSLALCLQQRLILAMILWVLAAHTAIDFSRRSKEEHGGRYLPDDFLVGWIKAGKRW